METLRNLNRRIGALPKGTAFTRLAIALARTSNDFPQAARLAKRWDETPEISAVLAAMSMAGTSNLKAAVSVGSIADPTWAGALVVYEDMAAEFVELLRPMTILGRLKSLRRVPPLIRFVSQNSGVLVGWVGGGQPALAGEMSLSTQTLGLAKCAGVIALTKELVESGNPDAEGLVRAELLAATAQFFDQQFIDPTIAAVVDISPASVTNGLTAIISTGTSVAAIFNDFQALFASLVDAGITFIAPALVMRPSTALALAMKRTSADVPAFPGITVAGGSLFGVPVVVSASVPGSVSGGAIIALVDAAEILHAEGSIQIDASEHASLQMRTDPVSGATTLVSLFQKNLVGLRVVREMNWQVRRAGAVAYLAGVQY